MQWSRNKQKACLLFIFPECFFLSDYNVAPPNTSSANCIRTAFAGLWFVAEDRVGGEWCRWGGPACKQLVNTEELRTEMSYLLYD